MISPDELMELAIQKARDGIAQGQTPFGCAISRKGKVIAVEHNRVFATTDITAHAEVNAIRAACLSVQDVHLSDCIVATTCEPCPMCMSALHWANVDTVYYGASIQEAADCGFNELHLHANDLLRLGGSHLRLQSGTRGTECRELFELWKARPDHVTY